MTGVGLDARVVVERGAFRLDAAVSAAAGEVVAVMGPSGAGKSTLLGALAGLVDLGEGHIRLGDRELDRAPRPRVRTTPSQRGIVLLGQEPRLFPHLTAHENVAFGLRVRGVAKPGALGEADEWLWRVGLDGMGDRRPAQLSGGQQQRVALARALATSPAALLLDEPLTSLDTETAADIRALLHHQLAATHTTAIVATHDAVDAVSLASSLVVLEDGRVTQSGPVRQVLAAPATRFAAAVAGLNRVAGSTGSGDWVQGPLVLAATGAASDLPGGTEVAAVFRPSSVEIASVPAETWTGVTRLEPTSRHGEWIARVMRLEQTPAGVRVRTAEPEVAVDVPADTALDLGLAPGVFVRLRIPAPAVRFVAIPRAEP
ncbi:sulfate/molybdate ABC transporter ATP-binding protein [Microbacterium sp. SSM24]|uniref:sulfate/molybdate ABC transporter ATP-binding protein n=1 Tax=Microbacterium sp. SSM24 TaxID=2991714 RepID=UPI002227DA52|nr:ATP-binding cassette domain-containing protein [Microbacterium sp. SSM24]MCW3492148.1 ATP-binding cassette domain-containing protein [Microbacterium sp. SSM24]